MGILFLEETHAEKKYRRDPGLEAGKWILSKFHRCRDSKSPRSEKAFDPDDALSLLSDDEQSAYSTSEGSPRLPSTTSSSAARPPPSLDLDEEHNASRSKPAATKAFTRQVVLNIVGYGILA